MAPRTRKKKAFGVITPRQVPNPRMPYPHQMNAIENLDQLDMRPSYSALLVLPTGGGKTYVASAWLIKTALDKGKKVLWLAHRTLLLDQAAEAFQEYTYEKDHPPLSPFRYRIVSGTSNHCRPSSISPKDDLLLVSKDSVTRNVKCLDHWLVGARELYLIIDEAHHSPAKSYRNIIDHIQEMVPCVKMIGLTATPFRKELDNTGPLREIFRDDIVYQISLSELIGSGILSKPSFEDIPTHESYGEELGMRALESIQRSDLIPDDIAMQIAQNTVRNGLIVKTYLDKKEEYGQTIVFVLNVTHAQQLAAVFQKSGIVADYIVSGVRDLETGKITKKEENDEKLKAYREGKLRILISVNILTEGADLPATKTVFLARPTVSSVLMTQMVGRALRGPKAGGTLEAYIVTFVDDWGDNIAWINPRSLFLGKNDPEAEQLSQLQRDIRAIAVSKIAEFAQMMDASIDTSALEKLPFFERIPVGMYVFTYLEAADEKTGEATECSCQVMVYSNAVLSYAEMMGNLPALFEAYGTVNEYLDAELLSDMERQCYANFFCGGMLPPYAPKDVINILKYYAQTGTIPEFYTFETVDKRLDLRRFAQYIADNSMDGAAQREFTDKLWEDDIIRKFFCNRKSYFYRTLDVELLKILHPDIYADQGGSPGDRRPPEDLDLDELKEFDPEKEAKLRDGVFKKARDADGLFQCAKCGLKKESKVFFHVDYMVPLSEGGKTAAGNLRILCRKCYEQKEYI